MSARRTVVGVGTIAAGALALAACGGGAEPAKSPSHEATQPATTAPPPPPAYPDPPHTAPFGSSTAAPPAASAGAASPLIEIDGLGRQIELAGSDCTTACRALASMERATGRLCAMPDEGSRCDDARGRVKVSRARVKKACGTCPGGPSTDEGAPIPSTP